VGFELGVGDGGMKNSFNSRFRTTPLSAYANVAQQHGEEGERVDRINPRPHRCPYSSGPLFFPPVPSVLHDVDFRSTIPAGVLRLHSELCARVWNNFVNAEGLITEPHTEVNLRTLSPLFFFFSVTLQ